MNISDMSSWEDWTSVLYTVLGLGLGVSLLSSVLLVLVLLVGFIVLKVVVARRSKNKGEITVSLNYS